MFHASGLAGSGNFATFFESLPIASTAKIGAVAKFLDVTPKSINLWLSGARTPPRAAVIALFHESHYGLSATSTHSENGAALARRLAASLQKDNDSLRIVISSLQIELDAAKKADVRPRYVPMNDPVYTRPGMTN